MEKLLVTADVVIPISSEPIRNGAVAIANGRIVDVGSVERIKTDYSSFRKITKPNSIILPGFVNAHTHLELSWVKGKIGNFEDFTGWLERLIALKSTPADSDLLEESARRELEEVVTSGVTTVGEISSLRLTGVRDILRKSRMRVIAFLELFDRFLPDISALEFKSEDIYQERPFPHAPYSCTPKLLEAVFFRASELGIPVGTHLGESRQEMNFLKNMPNDFERKIFPLIGKSNFKRRKASTPTRYMNRFLKERDVKLSAVHMVQVDSRDVEIIRNRGIGVILCPRSNIFLKVGKPNLSRIADYERVGLGTDGLSSNDDLDFFKEIRSLRDIMIEQGIERDAARRAVYCATLGGARSLFIEERTGSLEIGKDADIICVSHGKAAVCDPYLCVLSRGSDDLQFSMVKGDFIYEKDSLSEEKKNLPNDENKA